MELELFEEVSSERNDKRSVYLEGLIELLFENDSKDVSKIEKKYHCKIDVSIVKHHVLQYTYYYQISFLLFNSNLCLEIDSGIDSGTELINYSFDNPLEPESKMFSVLKDVVLQESRYPDNFSRRKAQAILHRDKHLIFDYERKNNYDNYVTGGNSKLKAKGLWTELYLEYIYEEVEADINFI